MPRQSTRAVSLAVLSALALPAAAQFDLRGLLGNAAANVAAQAAVGAAVGAATAPGAAPADPAAAATASPAASDLSAAVDPDTLFKGKMGGTFGKNIIEVMPAGKRIAVPAFRVAFVTDNSVSAQVRGSYLPGRDTSGARSSMYLALKGVSPQTLQRITDAAYADLLAQLAAAGREVVPLEQLRESIAGFKPTASDPHKPYTKEHMGQTASFFSPTGMPMVFTHLEGQWGDSGAFDLGNYRKMAEISGKHGATVITPLIVVNFARMTSSGNQSGLVARTAETGAELSMSVAAFSSYYARTEEFRNGMHMKGDEGGFSLAAPIASPLPFGTIHKTAQEDNAGVKGVFDLLGRAAGMANAGGAARSSTKAVAETSDEAYAAAAGDALRRTAVALGTWFRKYPAVN